MRISWIATGVIFTVSTTIALGQQQPMRLPATLEAARAMAARPPAAPPLRAAGEKDLMLALPAVPELSDARTEVVAERYPNGSVKVERQVIQDASGNYVNHGSYKMYDAEGKVVRSGQFRQGKQVGPWTQQLIKDEGHLFSSGQDKDFQGPFLSEASFADGKLDGLWTIKNREGKPVIEWSFQTGVRHGKSTWWHANGAKRLEAHYTQGVLDGEVQEWDRDGKSANQATYVKGRLLSKSVGWYALGQKHYEGNYLKPQNVPEPTYDWWNTATAAAPAPAQGADLKQGLWVSWYRNGTKKSEGQFDHDVPIGRFVWWYENGQKQAEGEYQAGVKTGTWITWHPNGLKESHTEFRQGSPFGKYARWSADGKLVASHDYGAAAAARTAARPPQYR